MSAPTYAFTAVAIAVSAAAAATLWWAATHRSGRVRLAYLWFAGTAAFWCLGGITQLIVGASLYGVSGGLSLADLPPLLALPAVIAGSATLVAAGRAHARDRWRTLGQRVATRPMVPRLADGYVAAAALFVVGWILLFGPDYAVADLAPGSFTADLIQPLAGLVALGLLLAMSSSAGWRSVPPLAAVLLVTVSTALGVGARIDSGAPGAAQQVVTIVAFAVLGLTPWLGERVEARVADPAGLASGLPGPAAVASTAAAIGAPVVCAWALAGGHGSPVLIVVASAAVLALAARLLALVAGGRLRPRAVLESARRFRELASLTSDAIVLCDQGGVVRYASPAVLEYGYLPEHLIGSRLDELVHPEDRPGSRRAVREALSQVPGPRGRFPCRVRAADGTWRHVEVTVSGYQDPAGTDQVLIAARDVSDQVALRRQVTHLTFHDGLTGLPNRAYLEERATVALAAASPAEAAATAAGAAEASTAEASRGTGTAAGDEAAQRAAGTAVIFLDLDGFTAVNDSAGHGAGDLLLAQAARRLRTTAPPHDTVVRWGSDEFAVLAEEAASPREVVELAERLAAVIAAEPFQVAGRDISLTASVGVAFAGPAEAGLVLRNADVAMAQAKEAGGGRVEVFAARMHEDVVRRMELTSDLQRAIAGGQLVLEYQPVMELGTSRVSGAEALVRWWRGGTAVPPGEFLGLAEESGLVVPLGDWVLRQACAQAVRWCRPGADVTVSVNFSPRQVSAADFPGSVLAALADTGLPPSALTIEVTERVLVEADRRVVAHLAELRAAGVRLAIDDFGTGYASLAYLRELSVDVIKIDPSFVAGLGEDETLTLLTRTIVQLGRDLGIKVVAEGIESSRQLGLLRDMGCGLGQGYLVAAPMAASEVESLLTAVATQNSGGAAPPETPPGRPETPQARPEATSVRPASSPENEPVVSLYETQ